MDDAELGEIGYLQLFAVFQRHFPQLSDDACHRNADAIMRALAKVESDLAVYDPATERAKLDHVRSLLQEVEIALDELHPRVHEAARLSAVQALIAGDASAQRLLHGLASSVRMLRPHIEAARIQAAAGVKLRADLHWEAASVVHACRQLWRLHTGNEGPRHLNPASPFGAFLQDVFEATGITASPRAAVNAWRRAQGPG